MNTGYKQNDSIYDTLKLNNIIRHTCIHHLCNIFMNI